MTLDDHLEKGYQDATAMAEYREKVFKEALADADNDEVVDILIDIITEDPSKAKRILMAVSDIFFINKHIDKIIDRYLDER